MRLLTTLLLICSLNTVLAQQSNHSVTIGTVNRTFIKYLPTGFNPSTESLPVVFCLHGLGDNAQNMSGIGLNIIADTARFYLRMPMILPFLMQ